MLGTLEGVPIHEKQDNGYTVARHILSELDSAKGHALFAHEVGTLVGDIDDGRKVGPALRDMHTRGWIEPQKVSPGSTRVRWAITDAGAAELEEYRVDRETSILVSNGREHEARQRYGDERVDRWWRECMNTDPDAAREERVGWCHVCGRDIRSTDDHAPGCEAGDRGPEHPEIAPTPPTPATWVATDTPTCEGCGRDLEPHKGHWTCTRRECPSYGDSQGDGAQEGEA